MRRRRTASATLLLAASLLSGSGCRRVPEPSKPAGAAPVSGALDTPEARAARQRRAEAVAGFDSQPGIAIERSPVLLDPDYGAPEAGTLEEGAKVEVLLVEPGFYGVRTGEKGLAYVPARSIRLLPGAVSDEASPRRPRREIVPQIVSLAPQTGTPLGTPLPTVSPSPGAAR